MTNINKTYEIKSFLSFINYFQNAVGHLDLRQVTLAKLLRRSPDGVQGGLASAHQLDLEDHDAVLLVAKRCFHNSRRLLGLIDVRSGNLECAGNPSHS